MTGQLGTTNCRLLNGDHGYKNYDPSWSP